LRWAHALHDGLESDCATNVRERTLRHLLCPTIRRTAWFAVLAASSHISPNILMISWHPSTGCSSSSRDHSEATERYTPFSIEVDSSTNSLVSTFVSLS